jgi:glutathione S-transferase
MTPMQALTADLLKPEAERDPRSVARARDTLSTSYAIIDAQLNGRTWLAGDAFSMADCTAAPALFYAVTYVPVPPEHAQLSAYFERLIDHPAVTAVIENARPFFKFYPGRAGLLRRFFDPADH